MRRSSKTVYVYRKGLANSLCLTKGLYYRPTKGGERACNSHRPFTDGKMLVVTNFRMRFEWQHPAGLGRRALPQPYKETANVIFSISPSVKGL